MDLVVYEQTWPLDHVTNYIIIANASKKSHFNFEVEEYLN